MFRTTGQSEYYNIKIALHNKINEVVTFQI